MTFLHRPRVQQTLLILFTGMVLISWSAAAYTWRLRCEGFGCIGVGIAWAMWTGVLYAPALLLGLLVRWLPPKAPGEEGAAPLPARWWPRWLLWLHLGLGVALGLYWTVSRWRF